MIIMEMRNEIDVKDARQRPVGLHHTKSFSRYLIQCSPMKKLHKEPDVYRHKPDGFIVGDQINVLITTLL